MLHQSALVQNTKNRLMSRLLLSHRQLRTKNNNSNNIFSLCRRHNSATTLSNPLYHVIGYNNKFSCNNQILRIFSTTSIETNTNHEQKLVKTTASAYDDAIANLPDGGQIHLDFFGEPVTFLGVTPNSNISNAVASLDGFIIGLATRGKSNTGGGEADGLSIQAAHSTALSWSETLRHAAVWNDKKLERAAPMLAYASVIPILSQAGVGYLRYIDSLLCQVDSGVEGIPPIQLFELAKQAAEMKDNQYLNSRERTHLTILHYLLKQEYCIAMTTLLRHLQICPGDGLALSVLIDLAHTVGDKRAALSGAASVAAYWNERRGNILRPGIPGHNVATGLVSLGFAVGGRYSEAEQMATFAMTKGNKVAGGVATWALAHVFDAEGRTAEGISACANSDGMRNFEECGMMFFDLILSGYGVRFALDREERGRGRSAALRLYDNTYERTLDNTGFSRGQLFDSPPFPAPMGWRVSSFQGNKENDDSASAVIRNLFGGISNKQEQNKTETDNDSGIVVKENNLPSIKKEQWVPSCEDILTWLPPTPQLLSDATLLLLRLTLNGTISSQNQRWESIRNAWSALVQIDQKFGLHDTSLELYPLANVTASLFIQPSRIGRSSGAMERLCSGMHKLGELLDLGGIVGTRDEKEKDDDSSDEDFGLSTLLFKEIVADKEPEFWLPVTEEPKKRDWKLVLDLLSSAVDGVLYRTSESGNINPELLDKFECWEFDARPIFEHAIVYAACKCGDYESLSMARSICSRGVTLRPSSPEEWWRYSIVLGLLGDEVASENALAASIAVGGGQGVRHD